MTLFLDRVPRYTMVALGCAVLHNAILIGSDALGANVLGCQAASAAILLPVGFWLQSHVTFQCVRSWVGFARYSAALITNFPIALGVLWLTRDILAVPMWVCAPISSVVLFGWNYVTSTWALALQKGMPVGG